MPGLPSIFDHAKTKEQRDLMRFVFSSTEFGRPYILPPDVPKDRVEIMRDAIAAAVARPGAPGGCRKDEARHDLSARPNTWKSW